MKFRIGMFLPDESYFVMDSRSGYVIESGLTKHEAMALASYLNEGRFKHDGVTAEILSDINDAEHIRQNLVAMTLPFEEIYKLYPRKIGKASGIRWLKSHVKTQEKFEKVKAACERYSSYVKREGWEEKYIQHFSTWVKRWEDWATVTEEQLKSVPNPARLFPSFGE